MISLTGIAVRETARLIISPGRVIDYLVQYRLATKDQGQNRKPSPKNRGSEKANHSRMGAVAEIHRALTKPCKVYAFAAYARGYPGVTRCRNSSCFNTGRVEKSHEHAVFRHGNPLRPAFRVGGKPCQSRTAHAESDVFSASDPSRRHLL